MFYFKNKIKKKIKEKFFHLNKNKKKKLFFNIF